MRRCAAMTSPRPLPRNGDRRRRRPCRPRRAAPGPDSCRATPPAPRSRVNRRPRAVKEATARPDARRTWWRRSPRSARWPERDQILRAIAAATARALGGEAVAQLLDTRAAAGAGSAALADLLDCASTIVDHGIQVAIRGRVAEANQHGLKLIMLFKPRFVKGRSWASSAAAKAS